MNAFIKLRRKRQAIDIARTILAFCLLVIFLGVALLPLWLEAPIEDVPKINIWHPTLGMPLDYDARVTQSGAGEPPRTRFYSRHETKGNQ